MAGGSDGVEPMGLDFKLRDFAYPFAILEQRLAFDRHPYLPPDEIQAYQLARLKTVTAHAYGRVPYYRRLFDSHGVHPSEITTLSDLAGLPCLDKATLARSFDQLTATHADAYGPRELQTSGTTGGRVRFLVDRASNILEFVYYWRFWGWHGYRLGDRFAELSAESFLPIEQHARTHFVFNPLLNRVLINSLLLSRASLDSYVDILRRSKPLFLKGLPSNLYVLALLCNEVKNHGIRFRAIFSQGENLSPRQRSLIEQVFAAPVFDSYGHLERTAAISQCPRGRYHVHADYGFVELVKPDRECQLPVVLSPGQSVAEVVGTSLHNLAMPLIRYRTGDLVIVDARQARCSCGRWFPVVESIVGRSTDVVITPDRRAITALYVALDRVPGIACAQIVQEAMDTLMVSVAPSSEEVAGVDDLITRTLHAFTGPEMKIVVRHVPLQELRPANGRKFQTVVSHLDPSLLMG